MQVTAAGYMDAIDSTEISGGVLSILRVANITNPTKPISMITIYIPLVSEFSI